MKINVQENNRVEFNIMPPLPIAVTLPLIVDDGDGPQVCVLYVSCAAFQTDPPPAVLIKRLAIEVAARIKKGGD